MMGIWWELARLVSQFVAKSLLAVSPAMMMRSVLGGMEGLSLNWSMCRSDQMSALIYFMLVLCRLVLEYYVIRKKRSRIRVVSSVVIRRVE